MARPDLHAAEPMPAWAQQIVQGQREILAALKRARAIDLAVGEEIEAKRMKRLLRTAQKRTGAREYKPMPQMARTGPRGPRKRRTL